MSDLKRLIKMLCFGADDRPNIVLSDPTKIRLNAEKIPGHIQLNGGFLDVDPFPLDTDLTVRSAFTTPNGIKQWTFFEVVRDEPVETTMQYRSDNGVREIYWDGAAWVTAGATDWNTELEIQTNISTFPFDNNTISVLTNMFTTDDSITPNLQGINLLGVFEFEVYEDLIKSLLMKMFEDIRPCTDAVASVLTTTSSFNLGGEYQLQNPGYNIVDVPRIYNKTDDPLEKNNLVDTYTPGALNQDGQSNAPGIVTTTVPIDAGKIFKMKIQYVPEIADYTDEDYFEVAHVPLVALETVEEIERRDGARVDSAAQSGTGGIIIRDLTNMTAVQVLPPAQIDLRIGYAVFTDSNRDQKRLMEGMEKFFQSNKLLFSFAFDEPYGLSVIKRFDYEAKGVAANLRKATGTFDIRGVILYELPALDVPLIEQMNVEITT